MPENIQYIRTCSIWRALEVIGDKPTLLIMESYWLGTRRFSGFQKQTGLLKSVISDRLQKLIKAGCIFKSAYSERPKRYEYRATEKFLDIYPVALCMLHWEKKWGRQSAKISVTLTHTVCGETADPNPVCGDCNQNIDPRDISWQEGLGVGMMKAEYGRRRRSTIPSQSHTPLFEDVAEIIGDRWTSLIIRSLFTGLNRYQDIQQDCVIATNVLSERLKELVDKAILQQFTFSEYKRVRYKLTTKGRDIYPILIALMNWGDEWYPAPEGSPLILTHSPCNSKLELKMNCAYCHEQVSFEEIEFTVNDTQSISTSLPQVS